MPSNLSLTQPQTRILIELHKQGKLSYRELSDACKMGESMVKKTIRELRRWDWLILTEHYHHDEGRTGRRRVLFELKKTNIVCDAPLAALLHFVYRHERTPRAPLLTRKLIDEEFLKDWRRPPSFKELVDQAIFLEYVVEQMPKKVILGTPRLQREFPYIELLAWPVIHPRPTPDPPVASE